MEPDVAKEPDLVRRPFRRLGYDIVLYGLMGGLSKSAGFILLPILTRRFSPSDYGILEMVISLTGLLAIFMSLNLESAIARFWSDWSRDGRQRAQFSTISLIVGLFGAALVALVWAFSAPLARLVLGNGESWNYVVIGAICAVLQAVSVLPQMVLRMQRKILRYNILGFLQTVLYVGVTWALVVHLRAGVLGAIVAMTIAQAIACILGYVWVIALWTRELAPTRVRESFDYSLPMLPAVVVTWVNKQVDRLLLLWLVGLGAVGIFGAAAKITLLVTALVAFFQQAWVPLALSMVDREEVRNDFYRRTLNYYLASMTIVSLVFVACSKELFQLLASDEYQSGYVVIPWLLGAQVLHGSASITNLGMLVTRKTFGNSVAAWIGALLNIAIGLMLIPNFGIWGAAIGMFIAELAFTSLLWRFSIKSGPIRFDAGTAFSLLGIYIASSVLMLGVFELVEGGRLSVTLRVTLFLLALIGVRISLGGDLKAFSGAGAAVGWVRRLKGGNAR